MPTSKKRINISVSDEIEQALERIAQRDDVPVATKAYQLLQKALLIEEDDALDVLAAQRDNKGAKFVDHQEAWN